MRTDFGFMGLAANTSPSINTADIRAQLSKGAEPTEAVATGFDLVREEAERQRQRFGEKLPPVVSAELYLMQGLSEFEMPAAAGNQPQLGVPYPPEFIFLLDVGLERLVGGSMVWQPVGYGDPLFPHKKQIFMRSIIDRASPNLIFPCVAGSIIVSVVDGTPNSAVNEGLTKLGIANISGSGTFYTAECKPFEEPSVCRRLEKELPFVKYAESNYIQRLIDFKPGWTAVRLT